MCTFLQYICWAYIPDVESCPEDLCTCIELLKAEESQAALDLVRSGRVPVRTPLCGMQCSLLQLAMSRNSIAELVVEHVIELLDAVKLRGEFFDEADFKAACASGHSMLVDELLKRGAPMSQDALHALVDRMVSCSSFRQQEEEMMKTARLLLDARAAVDQLGSRRETALTTLCGGVGLSKPRVLQWLLDQRADPNGADGIRRPLHALFTWPARPSAYLGLLIDRRADVNQHEAIMGNTPLHLAVDPKVNFDAALELKNLGADHRLKNHEGKTPAQILLAKGMPEQAAQLEHRPMNQEELEVSAALKHPVAWHFRTSFAQVSWVLWSSPERLRPCSSDESDLDMDDKLSSLLDGCSPKSVVIELPLTRYSEIREAVEFTAPEDGFTVRTLLNEIYKYYQESFSAGQNAKIQRYFQSNTLGDTFGYIRSGIPGTEDGEGSPERAAKRQSVQRIELRGDSVFFEGFSGCKYFEKDRRLCGSMVLGS